MLPLTLVYCTWFSLFTVGQDYLWVAEKGKLIFTTAVIGLTVNVGLNLVLIPVCGLWGAVLATSIANATNVGVLYWLNHQLGCANDRGVWICALIPLLMLLPPLMSVGAIVAVSLVVLTTTLIFSANKGLSCAELPAVFEKVSTLIGCPRLGGRESIVFGFGGNGYPAPIQFQ